MLCWENSREFCGARNLTQGPSLFRHMLSGPLHFNNQNRLLQGRDLGALSTPPAAPGLTIQALGLALAPALSPEVMSPPALRLEMLLGC